MIDAYYLEFLSRSFMEQRLAEAAQVRLARQARASGQTRPSPLRGALRRLHARLLTPRRGARAAPTLREAPG